MRTSRSLLLLPALCLSLAAQTPGLGFDPANRCCPDARYIRASVCSELYTLKLRRQQPDSPLLDTLITSD